MKQATHQQLADYLTEKEGTPVSPRTVERWPKERVRLMKTSVRLAEYLKAKDEKWVTNI
jgi:hypothetical protein